MAHDPSSPFYKVIPKIAQKQPRRKRNQENRLTGWVNYDKLKDEIFL
jgi:hypothetical protein